MLVSSSNNMNSSEDAQAAEQSTNTRIDIGDSVDELSSPEAVSPPQAPLTAYSGLSALIEAATSQLCDIAEEDVAMTKKAFSSTNATASAITCRSRNDLTPPMVIEQSQSTIFKTPQNFPDKLMTLCTDPCNSDSITFLPDGKFFAIRESSFQEKLLHHFDGVVANMDDFLDLAEHWGFSAIVDHRGIAVLRHPSFVAGKYAMCDRIKYGISPEAVRMQALPDRARIVVGSAGTNERWVSTPQQASSIKRRLSPSHLAHCESNSSSVFKQKVFTGMDGDEPLSIAPTSERRVSSGTESELSSASNITNEDSLRSLALAITTEKLQMRDQYPDDQRDGRLVDTAVSSATHEIVADAITTLLRDEDHSKKTFLKHEKELSRSSIPGVIPVCKQIFSPTSKAMAKKDIATMSGPVKSFDKTGPTRIDVNEPTTALLDTIALNKSKPQDQEAKRPARQKSSFHTTSTPSPQDFLAEEAFKFKTEVMTPRMVYERHSKVMAAVATDQVVPSVLQDDYTTPLVGPQTSSKVSSGVAM